MPTPVQEELLALAFCGDGSSLESSSAALSRLLEERFDDELTDLLPMIYARMKSAEIEIAGAERSRRAYAGTWGRNQIRVSELRRVTEALHREGIDAIALKGIGLALSHYGDIGLRPMVDMDLMIRPENARAAMGALKGLGWKSTYSNEDQRISLLHSTPFLKADGPQLFPVEIDLHWVPLQELCRKPPDPPLIDGFWKRSIAIKSGDFRVRILDRTDQLLTVAVHGYAWALRPSPKWAADCLTLLRGAGVPVEWDRLLAFAERNALSLPLHRTLSYINHRFGAHVPEDFLARLAAHPASKLEKLEDLALGSIGDRWLGALLKRWTNYARLTGSGSGGEADIEGFLDYLTCCWDAGSPRQLPRAVIARVVQRYHAIHGRG